MANAIDTLELHVKELSGYEYNAVANYFGEPQSPPEIIRAREAFRELSARLREAVAENEKLRAFVQRVADTDPSKVWQHSSEEAILYRLISEAAAVLAAAGGDGEVAG